MLYILIDEPLLGILGISSNGLDGIEILASIKVLTPMHRPSQHPPHCRSPVQDSANHHLTPASPCIEAPDLTDTCSNPLTHPSHHRNGKEANHVPALTILTFV